MIACVISTRWLSGGDTAPRFVFINVRITIIILALIGPEYLTMPVHWLYWCGNTVVFYL